MKPENGKECFEVKEFVPLNLIAAGIFYCLFLYGLYNTNLPDASYNPVFDHMLLITIIPALGYTYKAFHKTCYLKINADGIFVGKLHLTTWNHFIAAEYREKPVTGSIQDNFILIITYYRENLGTYVKEVPLTNTQDKSEEEIINAVNYFYTQWKNKTIESGKPVP